MRILEIISGGPPNGAAEHCRLLSTELARAGHEVTLVSRPGSWILDNVAPLVTPVASSLKRSIAELGRMTYLVEKGQFDVIHTHMSSAHFFGVLLRMLTGTPTVATAHRCCFQLHWMMNDRVIGCSQVTSQFQRRFNLVPAHRLETICNVPDIDRFQSQTLRPRSVVRRECGFDESTIVMGYIGGWAPRKGLHNLLRSFAEIRVRYRNVALLVVGNHQATTRLERNELARAASLDMASGIHWAGVRQDIPELMQAIDMFVCPSLREDMPISILEAMAAGLPIVATRVGGIPEVITDRETGLLVQPGDVMGLTSRMVELIENPTARRWLGQQARQRIFTQFSPHQHAMRTVAVLSAAAASRQRHRPTAIARCQIGR